MRRQAPQRESIYSNYMADDHRHLIGVASSPLITTVADAAGLTLYFSVARLILPAFS